jgi:hypothetical protein
MLTTDKYKGYKILGARIVISSLFQRQLGLVNTFVWYFFQDGINDYK